MLYEPAVTAADSNVDLKIFKMQIKNLKNAN